MKCFLLLFGLCSSVIAQDFSLKMEGRQTGYSYKNDVFPLDMKVWTLEKKASILKANQLTLIYIWGTCCGAESETWDRARGFEMAYQSHGLKMVSVNFENGASLRDQYGILTRFFERKTQPKHLYLDGMGYVVDGLRVSSFPAYYLISGKGVVVFQTNALDEEGVGLLHGEIRKRLNM